MAYGRAPQVHWLETKKTWILSSHQMTPMVMSALSQYATCFQLWQRAGSTPTSLCVDFHEPHFGSKCADLTNLLFLVLNSLCSPVSHDRHGHTSHQCPLLPTHSHHTYHLLLLRHLHHHTFFFTRLHICTFAPADPYPSYISCIPFHQAAGCCEQRRGRSDGPENI